MSTAYLVVRDLHKTFGAGETAVHALQGVSLSAEPGELVAVRGRSGGPARARRDRRGG